MLGRLEVERPGLLAGRRRALDQPVDKMRFPSSQPAQGLRHLVSALNDPLTGSQQTSNSFKLGRWPVRSVS
jgi:hypothetical protein